MYVHPGSAVEDVQPMGDSSSLSFYINIQNNSNNMNVIGFQEQQGGDFFSNFIDIDKLAVPDANAGAKQYDDQRYNYESNNSYSSSGAPGVGGDQLVMEAKKAMPPDKLAELWTIDPKRAKRILANRQSAARSKERKARYIAELEQKLRSLQTKATTLSAQLTLFQRDTTGLSTENNELKIQVQAMEQQAQMQDALNQALMQEAERLQMATGDISNPLDSSNLHGMPSLVPAYNTLSNCHTTTLQLPSSPSGHNQPPIQYCHPASGVTSTGHYLQQPQDSTLTDYMQNDPQDQLQPEFGISSIALLSTQLVKKWETPCFSVTKESSTTLS